MISEISESNMQRYQREKTRYSVDVRNLKIARYGDIIEARIESTALH